MREFRAVESICHVISVLNFDSNSAHPSCGSMVSTKFALQTEILAILS